MKYSDFLSVIALMEDVGKRILTWRIDEAYKHLNSVADFKTEADQCAHNLIFTGLSEIYSNVEIISEESEGLKAPRPDAYWLIDPIDGTASWYHGFDGFVTQAAYIEAGIPLFGVVYAPALKKTWTALRDSGAYINGKRLPLLQPSDRLLLVDNTSSPHGIANEIALAMPVTGYIESGSLGLKTALVADGTADLFIKDVCVRDWDLAPAAVVLAEVGGAICMSDGSPYIFDGPFEKYGGFIVARDLGLLSKAIDAFAGCKGS